MTRDEMKNKISLALKDPLLQQGFEVICKENAVLKDKIGMLDLFCGGDSFKQRRLDTFIQIANYIEKLEKENAELKADNDARKFAMAMSEKVEKQLREENADLDCQKNRNKYCYSCANATERCFRNETGCPCEKYKSYKDVNAELKGLKDVATLIRANNDTVITLMQLNNKLVSKSQQLTKAKEIIKQLLLLPYANNEEVFADVTSILDKAEQFLSEVEK